MHAMNPPTVDFSVAQARRTPPWISAALAAFTLAGCVVAPPLPPPPVHSPPPRVVVAPAPAHLPPVAVLAPQPNPVAGATTPMYFYPERGQAESQQDRDRYECYRWAVNETGADPGMTTLRQSYAELQVTPPLRDGSGVVAGAATGALLGAVVSGPRQAGGNAVIGAIFGAVLGASAQESRAQFIENQQARRQQAAVAANAAARAPVEYFRRAMSACMSGRGYRVG